MLSRNFKIILFYAVACLFFSGCESVKSAVGIKQSKVWIEKINFKAAANANNSAPIKVDVVIAYKDELATEIGKLDANTYFQKVKKLKSDAGDDLDIFSIAVLPDSSASLDIAPSNSAGVVALMFARYDSPGDHRTNVSADYEIQVDLNKNDLKITTVKKG
jgi:predicted component of type VI protein secretion system